MIWGYYKDEAFQIIGAAQEVHRQLGHGFLEAVYQEALAVEFTLRTIPFEKEKSFPVFYKNQTLNKYYHYQADFYCYGKSWQFVVISRQFIFQMREIGRVGRLLTGIYKKWNSY